MTEFNFDEYVNHLEFLGYDLKKDEHEGDINYLAIHPIHGGVNFSEYLSGVLFQFYYSANEQTQNIDKTPDLLKTLNDLNNNSWVSNYHLVDDGSVRKMAFYLGAYNKKSFGSFVQAWNWDILTRLSHKDFSAFFPTE